MLYRHMKRYQALLQSALRIARQQPGYSLDRLLEETGLSGVVSHDTIDRFKRAQIGHYLKDVSGSPSGSPEIEALEQRFLRADVARNIWEFCDRKGYLERALAAERVSKSSFFSIREAANAVHCLLNAHERRQIQFFDDGLSGEYICYKASFKHPDSIVKSVVDIDLQHSEYFSFKEHQRATGRFHGGLEDQEVTTGFGIIKSKRLWIFASESNSEQPRLFCFFKPITERVGRKNAILGYYGHLMEGTQDEIDNFLSIYVLMVSRLYDERVWREESPGNRVYKPDEHHDIFPVGKKSMRSDDWPKANRALPQKFIRYVLLGKK